MTDADLARFGLARAAGEHDYDADTQLRTLTRGGVQIWQPDPSWNGGLARSVFLVDLAWALGIPSFPHGSALPVAVHLASLMSADVVPAVEYHLTLEPLRQSVYAVPLSPDRGLFSVVESPGLTTPYLLDEADVCGSVDAA